MEQIVIDHQTKSIGMLETSCHTEIRSFSSVISGYEYRWFFGAAVPFLRFVNDVGEGAFPLIGHHLLDFDLVRRCPSCMDPTDDYGNICKECKALSLYRQLACILDGPGEPFGKHCQIDSPACDNENWAKSVCYAPWIVYVANVFGLIKVGISRKNRSGCEMGFTQRLLSQGACRWIAIGPVSSLKEALVTEERISSDLAITQRVTQHDRWHHLIDRDVIIDMPRDDIIYWAHENNLPLFIEGDFTNAFSWPSDDIEITRTASVSNLYGMPVFYVGPMIGLQTDNELVETYDLSQLTGKTIIGDL